MSKFTNKDYINISSLVLIFLLILFSIVGFDYVNGSTVDWDSQHWIIPEYFRTLFYDTKDIFPSFAFNLGAGQNIYNLSYYGLLSPIVLISYLFPFIKMVNYIEVSMIIVVILSIILMYYWLKSKFNSKYSFLGTLLFLLSGPLIYHTHRHIMFVNYMPFLLLALIGVDNYFSDNKKSLLVISVFLVIMSSYYYSVGAIIAVVLYGIYKYIQNNKKITFKSFFKTGIKFMLPIVLAIMMSAVLILPTFYALISGRADITTSVDWLKLIIPKFNLNEILYNSYTIGLTSAFILAIIFGIFAKKREQKFLSLVFSLIIILPIIIYLLSGLMYVRGKVLIPLLPLAILLMTLFIYEFNLKENKTLNIMFLAISIMQVIVHINNGNYIFILDVIITLLGVIAYIKTKNKNYFIYPICVCAFVCCLTNNYSEKLVSKEDIALQHNTYNYDILNPILEAEDNIYRVGNDIMGIKNINRVINSNYYLPSIYSSLENQNYFDFAVNNIGNEIESRISTAIMPGKNILFNTYMGTKYIITNSDVQIGYKNVKNSNIYVNKNVLPIGYSTSKTISKSMYDELDFPEKSYALLTNVIVENKNTENDYEYKVVEEKLNYDSSYNHLTISKEEGKYIINSDKEGSIELKLDRSFKDKILFITFDMEYAETCLIGDTSITINGVKNTLSCKGWTYHNKNYTFEYAISSNDELDTLNISFEEGKYIISNIKTYSLDYKNITNFVESVDQFKINKEKTKGDKIVGDINVTENGYFVLTIPYEEKGFSIYVDNKLIEYDKINSTFIGFDISEGYHEISIIYTSPYLFEGMIASILGHMLFLPVIYSDLFKKRKECKR